MKRESVIKVGLLTIVSLGLLVAIIIWLRGTSFVQGKNYSVLFRDVDGLQEGAPVQMMGIRVGFIDSVEPEIVKGRYFVRVGFSIQSEDMQSIPKGSTLSLEQSGLIGEKFLEITPPQIHEALVSTLLENPVVPQEGMPVKFLYKEGLRRVGYVERVEKLFPEPDQKRSKTQQYLLAYRIIRPGSTMPESPVHHLEYTKAGKPFLKIAPSQEDQLEFAPDPNLVFTVENPVRMKEFLEIQLASAESLRITNEKISHLLTDDTIATLNSTLDNVEILTKKSSKVLDSADALMKTTGRDLEQLVQESHRLTVNIGAVSNNLNEIIGDPRFKEDILATMDSIQQSTDALNAILKDPSIRETLTSTRDAARSISELAKVMETTAKDREIQQRLDHALTTLNASLNKLSVILDNVETLTSDDDQSIKSIVQDAKETTDNMKKFSQKLNKRFLLFRLLF